jgi:hypothetical protein
MALPALVESGDASRNEIVQAPVIARRRSDRCEGSALLRNRFDAHDAEKLAKPSPLLATRSIEQPFAIDEVFHTQFCGEPLAVSYWFFAGAPGSTAATPSGLMLKAKNINGSLPRFPHWCTRPYGS